VPSRSPRGAAPA